MLQPRLEPPTCGRQTIQAAMLSAYRFPTLAVADEIGLFEYLDETPASVAGVAHNYGITQRAAEVMLGVLADGGHLVRHGECFHLTESSRQFLLPGSLYYQGAMLSMMGQMPITRDGLREALFKSEAATNSAVFDTDMWQSSEENAAQLKAAGRCASGPEGIAPSRERWREQA